MEQEFYDFIQGAEAKHTKYGNTTAFNALIKRYLDSVNETSDILSLQPEVLNNLLRRFFIGYTQINKWRTV